MDHVSIELESPAREFARKQAKTAARGMLLVISGVKWFAWVITVLAMAVSYQHQMLYLRRIKVDWFGSIVGPIIFDSLTIACVMVVGAQAMRRLGKVTGISIVLFPVGASGYINIQASPSHAVAIVYSLFVLAIPASEMLKASMGPNWRVMIDTEVELDKASRAPLPSKAKFLTPATREERARQRAGYARMSSADKRNWTRNYREQLRASMPVSPGVGPVAPRLVATNHAAGDVRLAGPAVR